MKNQVKTPQRSLVRIGYACQTLSLDEPSFKTVTQTTLMKMASSQIRFDRLLSNSHQNLTTVLKGLKWGYEHNYRFFRLYSNIFPHLTNRKLQDLLNETHYDEYYQLRPFQEDLQEIGKFVQEKSLRVTFHPCEMVHMGAIKDSVREMAVDEVMAHGRILQGLKKGSLQALQEAKKGKITEAELKQEIEKLYKDTVFTLHGGGKYDDKRETLKRWKTAYLALPDEVRHHLVIENDERNFSIFDLLPFSEDTKIPIVLDFFHQDCFELLFPDTEKATEERYAQDILPRVMKVWQERGMKPKFHVSEQWPKMRIGTHSEDLKEMRPELLDLQDGKTKIPAYKPNEVEKETKPAKGKVSKNAKSTKDSKDTEEYPPLDFDIVLECKKKEFACEDILKKYPGRYNLVEGEKASSTTDADESTQSEEAPKRKKSVKKTAKAEKIEKPVVKLDAKERERSLRKVTRKVKLS